MIVNMQPRERPILFRPEMVRAVLSGAKRQTRRPVYPPVVETLAAVAGDTIVLDRTLAVLTNSRARTASGFEAIEFRCPYGEAGDRLWVRESFAPAMEATRAGPRYRYAADYVSASSPAWRWKPSIHMPREACRLVLLVTETRAEPVRSISIEDAEAEGVPLDEFGDAWDRIYARLGLPWKSNPWVWIISFQRYYDE